MSADVVGRIVDVGRRLRHQTVEHAEEVRGDALLVGEDGQGAGRVLDEEAADAVADRGRPRRDLRGDVDDLLVSPAADGDAAHAAPASKAAPRPSLKTRQNSARTAM